MVCSELMLIWNLNEMYCLLLCSMYRLDGMSFKKIVALQFLLVWHFLWTNNFNHPWSQVFWSFDIWPCSCLFEISTCYSVFFFKFFTIALCSYKAVCKQCFYERLLFGHFFLCWNILKLLQVYTTCSLDQIKPFLVKKTNNNSSNICWRADGQTGLLLYMYCSAHQHDCFN